MQSDQVEPMTDPEKPETTNEELGLEQLEDAAGGLRSKTTEAKVFDSGNEDDSEKSGSTLADSTKLKSWSPLPTCE